MDTSYYYSLERSGGRGGGRRVKKRRLYSFEQTKDEDGNLTVTQTKQISVAVLTGRRLLTKSDSETIRGPGKLVASNYFILLLLINMFF